MMNIDYMKIFNRVIAVVVGVMLVLLTLGLIIGVLRLFINIGHLFVERELTRSYLEIVSHVLTLFILIELLRSIADYFTSNRLRMTFIVDAAIVFVLREIMIALFEHRIGPPEIYALSALLFVLTVLRVGSVLLYQRGTGLIQREGQAGRGEPAE